MILWKVIQNRAAKSGSEFRTMTHTESELLKAELMASAPEHVHTWLRERAELPKAESVALHYSDDLELALLTRKSDLIELGVARYGLCDEAIRNVFQSAPATDHGRAVRVAALSNQVLKRTRFWGDPAPIPHRVLTALDLFALIQDPAYRELRDFVISART